MKVNIGYIIVSVFIISVLLFSCNNAQKAGSEDFGIKACSNIDTLLQSFENKVHKASDYCLSESKNTDSLYVLFNQINSANAISQTSDEFYKYCKSFCLLHISLSQIKFEQDEEADATIMQALDLLNGIDEKNSEIYSLLAILQGMSINYRSAMTLTVAAEKCKMYAKRAIELNNKNPRAHLSLGIYDFFTPAVYQGGKIAESCFLKSIELNQTNTENIECLPKWGKDLSYRYIIRYYLKNKKPKLVKKYLKEALSHFPKDTFFLKIQNEA